MKRTKIIDSHMHIPQWLRDDGMIAFDVVNEYRENNGIEYVDNMCCSNNANLWGGYEPDQSILGAISKVENPYVFNHGCLYIPQDVKETEKYDFVAQIEELMELGMDGIKICDFKPDAYKILNVEKRLSEYEKVIDYCEKYNVHMCWHVADPDFFWDETKVSDRVKELGWFYGDGTYPSYEKLIGYACDMIERHPRLNVQLAHAFFKSDKPDEVEALLSKHPNVTVDFAPGGEMFAGFSKHYDRWCDIFRNYSDRFLFATDASVTYTADYMSGLAHRVLRFLTTDDVFNYIDEYVAHGINLSGEHLENMLHRNHERTVGYVPRQISTSALKRYIARYLPLMPDSQNRKMIENYYRKNYV